MYDRKEGLVLAKTDTQNTDVTNHSKPLLFACGTLGVWVCLYICIAASETCYESIDSYVVAVRPSFSRLLGHNHCANLL